MGSCSERLQEATLSTLRIYGIARTRAFRVIWTAMELGLDYEHIPIETGSGGARKPDYLAINPNGRLPAIMDDGFALWESLAITMYLAKKHANGRLYPGTLEDEARTWQWSLWSVQEVDRPVNIWSLHAIRLPPGERNAALREEALNIMARPFRVLDEALANRDFLLGREFTIVDLNVAAVISRAVEMDLTATPQLARWLQACLSRPAAQEAGRLRADADATVPIEITREIAKRNRL